MKNEPIDSGVLGAAISGKYRITGRLGTGGMCDVFEAEHMLIGKRLAIKVLRPQFAADPTTSLRFEQEARAASRIHHPNAINVMDVGMTDRGSPFIVMEFVGGETLDRLIHREGPLAPERTGNILRQAAGALEAAHSAGIIHRDIKPQNIIVSSVDGQDWIKVVDFGVSKALEDRGRGGASITGANFIVGTPRYMSPEQCENVGLDARSDVYSLGVVLYEMLAGVPPFEDDSLARLLVRHSSEPAPSLRGRRADVSPEVDAVVMGALEKDPDRRPQGAVELSRLFDRAVGTRREGDQDAQQRGRSNQRIEVPLGQDEATIVRQKPASYTARQAVYDQQSNSGLDQRHAGGEALARGRPPYYDQGQPASHTGFVIALVALLVVAVGVAAYLYFNGFSAVSGPAQDSISSAQQSIADAIARVDSLPRDHPLRTYLLQLEQWQGELKAYSQMPERTQEMKATADQYKIKADQISGQARIAIAALARQANQNSQPQPTGSMPAPSPDQRGAAGNSGSANAEQSGQPGHINTNANRNTHRPTEEPPSPLPVKPQPSPPRPDNSNSGR